MNQKPLFLTVAAALLVIGGFFWVMQKRQTNVNQPVVTDPVNEIPVQAEPEVQTNVSDWKPQQQVTKTFKPVVSENGWVWFPIPELGIEIKVRKEVAGELVYRTKEIVTPDRAPFVSVQFTTKGLLDIARKLYQKEFEEDGGYVCGVGSFNAYQSIPVDLDNNEIYEYSKAHGIKLGGSFVWYDSPQSPCVYTPDGQQPNLADAEYEMSIRNWWGRPSSEYTEKQNLPYHLQKAVRKIQ